MNSYMNTQYRAVFGPIYAHQQAQGQRSIFEKEYHLGANFMEYIFHEL